MTQSNPVDLLSEDSMDSYMTGFKETSYIKPETWAMYAAYNTRCDVIYKHTLQNVVVMKRTGRLTLSDAVVYPDIDNVNIPAFNDFVEHYNLNLYVHRHSNYAKFATAKCKLFMNPEEIVWESESKI